MAFITSLSKKANDTESSLLSPYRIATLKVSVVMDRLRANEADKWLKDYFVLRFLLKNRSSLVTLIFEGNGD